MDTLLAPTRREASRRRNRDALLKAAREVFAEIGYDAGSVREIVGRSGLALGTFYNYFPDKSAILEAILEEDATALRPRFRAARKVARSFPQFVEIECRSFFDHVASNRGGFELLRRNSAVIREMFQRPAFAAGLDDVTRDLDEMVARGLAGPKDTAAAAGVLWAVCIELASQMARDPDPDPEATTAFAVQLLLNGLPWREMTRQQPG